MRAMVSCTWCARDADADKIESSPRREVSASPSRAHPDEVARGAPVGEPLGAPIATATCAPPPLDIGAACSLNPRYVPARGHAGLVTRIVLAGGGDRRLAAAAG